MYARCITRWDFKEARRQLKLSQRENIAWERDTVWRQMIGQARRGEGDPSEASTIRALGGTLVVEPEKGLLDVETPAGRFRLTVRQLCFIISVTVFVILLNVHVVDSVQANRCLAILVLATLLWATEAIPLFVTSMGIPMLLVLFHVIRDPKTEEPLTAHEAAEYVVHDVLLDVLSPVPQVDMLCDVLTNHNVVDWRLHDRLGAEQVQHRPRPDHSSAQPSWDEAAYCAPRVHGRLLFCKYVDQVSILHPWTRRGVHNLD